jgi:hypothetical protein
MGATLTTLDAASTRLADDAQSAQQQIQQLLVSFQFQDRLNQVLTLLHGDMQRLEPWSRDPHGPPGELDPTPGWPELERATRCPSSAGVRSLRAAGAAAAAAPQPSGGRLLLETTPPMAKTILVIDDSSSLRMVVKMTLQGAGYDVMEADDGLTALKQLDGRKIHLAVCDVNMPGMDGISFVTQARRCRPTASCR